MPADQDVDKSKISLSYFEDVLAVEFAEINARRERRRKRRGIKPEADPIAQLPAMESGVGLPSSFCNSGL